MHRGSVNDMMLSQEGRDRLKPRMRWVLRVLAVTTVGAFAASRVNEYTDGPSPFRSIDDIFLLMLILFLHANMYNLVMRVADKLSQGSDANL